MRRIKWGVIGDALRQFTLLLIGALLSAFAYAVFQVPFNIAAGGIGGVSIVVNHYTGLSVGMLYALMNIPLLILGFFQLGRWGFLFKTVFSVALFSLATDYISLYLPLYAPQFPLTGDLLLNTIYGGIVGGIGAGLIFRAGATMGGTGIVGRVIQMRTGTPLSQVYLWTDGLIVITMGIVFGWEVSLYAMLAVFLSGLASDYTLEGPSSVRTASIITNCPEEMTAALMAGLDRGASRWEITGGYTGETRHMIFCTIFRPQVNDLKRIVGQIDENAFVIIGDAHQALGSGFVALRRK
ncbi:MAG: YitT family protein [Caldilineaceae bacterium]|nr:YitT family protein [Caldilineaceae bacterium]